MSIVKQQPMPKLYVECILTGYDEYWGKWLECECGYKNNVNGAKFCGGCGRFIHIVEKNENAPEHYGCR